MAQTTTGRSLPPKISLITTWFFCLACLVLPTIRSGLNYPYGIGFWGPNGHDGVWHLSLINNITNPFSIDLPMFHGEKLTNYHPLFDIFLALVHRLTGIPASLLLFQVFPVVSSSLILFLSYQLGKLLTGKHGGGLALMFMNTFGSSLGWIVTLFRSGQIGGESLFWSMQSISTQLNPPYALSLIIILAILLRLLQKQRLNLVYICLLASLPIIKVYSAVAGFCFFFFYICFSRQWLLLKQFILGLVLSGSIFLFYNPKSASMLSLQPFWFLDSMVDSLDRLYLPFLTAIRTSSQPGIIRLVKYLIVQLIGLTIFIVGNYSWRLLFFSRLTKITATPFFKAVSSTAIILFLIPLLFVQHGTPWNTIQFVYYSLFLTNILFSVAYTDLKLAPSSKILLLFFILFPNYETIKNYLGDPPPSSIHRLEVPAITFLRQQPRGVVLSYPYDPYLRRDMPTPVPLYAYETTSYLSAYSQQPVYLEDEMNLKNSGYDYQGRRQQAVKFFQQLNRYENRGFLLNNQIDYIYLVDRQLTKTDLAVSELSLDKIFDNQYVQIYKVNK